MNIALVGMSLSTPLSVSPRIEEYENGILLPLGDSNQAIGSPFCLQSIGVGSNFVVLFTVRELSEGSQTTMSRYNS